MSIRNITITAILFIVLGCSTKKNTWLRRNYHNLTAYYNVYYNGKESFEIGEKAIRENYKNNYMEILPMFESSDPEAVTVAIGDMDRAIEKGSKLIDRHSITVKPKNKKLKETKPDFYNQKEFNAYVDDAYLLIGKSQIIKHEFLAGIRTMQFVVREYPNKPAMYQALIWIARAYTEMGDYVGAQAAFESYDLAGTAPESLYGNYMAVYANLMLAQNKLVDAIPYLEKAIVGTNKRLIRLRYQYILAQLYAHNDRKAEASELFAIVAKKSPIYEMTFNAKVNQASIAFDSANLAEVQKLLNKLIRDKKNKEYLDRVYYAYGKVWLNQEDIPQAIEKFEKSVESSVSDDNQKGLSFIELGKIYYAQKEYEKAFLNYDSALVYVYDDIEGYDEVVEKHASLDILVSQTAVVEEQDSLQRLADMSEPVLLAYLDEFIEKKKEEKERLEEEKRQAQEDDFLFNMNNPGGAFSNNMNSTQSGKWYFYNPSAMGMGKSEFMRKWGRRKLEDNWRRKNKSKLIEEETFGLPGDPFASENGEPAEGDSTSVDQLAVGESATKKSSDGIPTRDELLAGIPSSPEARIASDLLIENALMEVGLLFNNRLENYSRAIETFNELLSRYPKAESREAALVGLYTAYRLNGDEAGMAVTRKKLESEFPDSQFVAYLNDPDFFTKLEAEKKARELAYEETYDNFLFGKFDEVLSKATPVISEGTQKELINKYQLLRALSYGKKGNAALFKADLEAIIERATGKQEIVLAQALLDQLAAGKEPVPGGTFSSLPKDAQLAQQQVNGVKDGGVEVSELGFVYVEKEAYSLVVMGIDRDYMNRAIYNVADYNFSRFLLSDFEISQKRLINGKNVLIVSGFKNRTEAMDYYYSLRENPGFFNFDQITTRDVFVISKSNESKFYLSGLIEEYIEFFNKYYLSIVDKKELEKVTKEGQPEANADEKRNIEPSSVRPVEEQPVQDSVAPESETFEGTEELEKDQSQISESEKNLVVENVATEEHNSVDEVEQKGAITVVEDVKADGVEAKETVAVEEPIEQEEVAENQEVVSYELNKTAPHSVLLAIRNTRMDFNRLATVYTNYAKLNLKEGVKVALSDLGTSHKLIEVSGFKDAAEASLFIKDINTKAFLNRDFIRKEHYLWSVSDKNNEELKVDPKLESYDEFYKTNY